MQGMSRARLFLFILWVFSKVVLVAGPLDPPGGYYSSAEGLSGAALEAALHEIIDDHTMIDYSWPPFQAVDRSPDDATQVELIYSPGTRGVNENGGSVGDWNREHLWPRSFGIFNDGGPDNSDIFNLRPCDVQVNSERGSLFFDDTEAGQSINLQFAAPGCSKDNDSWEIRGDEKGDVARSCFYMAVRYDGSDGETNDLVLSDTPNKGNSEFGRLQTLLRWHRLDPVTKRERERNQAVYEDWQGNRNPFIDRPEFAEQLFLAAYTGRDEDGDSLGDFWEWTAAGTDQFGALEDPDEDLFPMLLEYAFLSNPMEADGEAQPILRNEGREFVYYRNLSAVGLSYVVETTTSLKSADWMSVTEGSSVSMDQGNGRAEVVVTLPAVGDGRRFYRLKVSTAGR